MTYYFLICNAINEWKIIIIRDAEGKNFDIQKDFILIYDCMSRLKKILRSLSHFAYYVFTMRHRAQRLQCAQ